MRARCSSTPRHACSGGRSAAAEESVPAEDGHQELLGRAETTATPLDPKGRSGDFEGFIEVNRVAAAGLRGCRQCCGRTVVEGDEGYLPRRADDGSGHAHLPVWSDVQGRRED